MSHGLCGTRVTGLGRRRLHNTILVNMSISLKDKRLQWRSIDNDEDEEGELMIGYMISSLIRESNNNSSKLSEPSKSMTF